LFAGTRWADQRASTTALDGRLPLRLDKQERHGHHRGSLLLIVRTSSVVQHRRRGCSRRRSGSRRAPTAGPAVGCSFAPGAVTSAARIASLHRAYSTGEDIGGVVTASVLAAVRRSASTRAPVDRAARGARRGDERYQPRLDSAPWFDVGPGSGARGLLWQLADRKRSFLMSSAAVGMRLFWQRARGPTGSGSGASSGRAWRQRRARASGAQCGRRPRACGRR
jgi:hypothetical protein